MFFAEAMIQGNTKQPARKLESRLNQETALPSRRFLWIVLGVACGKPDEAINYKNWPYANLIKETLILI